MEAFGKKLKDERISRGLDLDQISRETNITRRYLEALEDENFTVFPGEPYILGFLRNYCEYLGLNSNEFISSYKHLKIQETPTPLYDLIPKRPITDRIFSGSKIAQYIIGILVVLAVIVGIVTLAGKIVNSKPEEPKENSKRTPVTYEVTGSDFKQRVYIGDILVITAETGMYKMEVSETSPSLKLETPLGSRIIDLGQELMIDLSGDDQSDVSVFVADLFKNDPSRGADVRLSTAAALPVATDIVDGAALTAATADVSVPVAGTATANSKQLVLFEGGSAYPVTLNATFRGYCLFRYETDRSNREERYYQKSELLTIQANNGIRIWASNGNSVKLQVMAGGKTVELEVSRPGEVLVRDLKWLKDEESGRFKFVVMDID